MNTFELGGIVFVSNRMQSDYCYKLDAPMGVFPKQIFSPSFTPNEMLRAGVFEGKYMTDCKSEYPESMFTGARFSATPDPVNFNAFKAKSRNPLSYWREQGWINANDPRGWFEWYCRFWLGRRTNDDARQIARWQRFAPRFAGTVRAKGQEDVSKCKATRQGLLQWSHDPLPDFPTLEGESAFAKLQRIVSI